MSADNKRGQAVALFGLAIQAALTGVMCLVWLSTGSDAARATFFLLFGSMGIWTVSAILFYCRHMAELEKLELDELTRQGAPGLFGEQAAEMRLAQRRLTLVERFFVPIITLLTAGYLAAMGILLLVNELAHDVHSGRLDGALTWAFVCLGASFVAFLASRYAIGMARDTRWRLLRAGGSYLTVCSLAVALLCFAYFLARVEFMWVLRALPFVVPAIMAVMGIEMVLNQVLDLYRPRRPGVEVRPAFDSRLANLLSEPGSLARSVAEALNYQFGFEVSRTWFYQLLQKTLVPLILFGAAAMLAASMVVVVTPGREAIVLTWGNPPANRSTLPAGTHFKWPWPVQTAAVIDTQRIRTLPLGVGDMREASGDVVNGTVIYVWNKEHGERREFDFLVPRTTAQAARDQAATQAAAAVAGEAQGIAAKPATAPSQDQAAQYSSVGTVRITASLQYRVVDPYRFRFGFDNAEKLLSDIAQRELTRYAARRDIDTLMSVRRDELDRTLYKQIDGAAGPTGMNLGIEVVQVSLGGLHPPTEVAEAFEEVVKANHERQGMMLKAQSARDSLLSETAGSAQVATALALAAERTNDSRLSAAERAAAQQESWRLLDQAGGRVRQIISQAQAGRWKTVNKGRGRYLSLQRQLAAWQQAPEVYELNEKLQVYRKAMDGSRKYILGIDPNDLQIWQPDDRRSAGGVFGN